MKGKLNNGGFLGDFCGTQKSNKNNRSEQLIRPLMIFNKKRRFANKNL